MASHVKEVGCTERLPEEVLGRIISVVNKDCGNEAVHCMQVCKRWKVAAPSAISSLTLQWRSKSLYTFVQLRQFTNVSTLTLKHCSAVAKGWQPLFASLGKNFPRLTALNLVSVKPPLSSADMSALFHHCRLLNLLSIDNSLESNVILPFEAARGLTSLHISQAHRISLAHISPLVHLRTLHLTDSIIEHLPPLANFSLLQILDLSKCSFDDRTVRLASLPGLTTLNLSGCDRLCNIPGISISALPQLHTLDISGCPELRPLPTFAAFANLQSLSVIFSPQDLPQSLSNLTSLKRLQLHDSLGVAVLGLPSSLEDLSLTLPRDEAQPTLPAALLNLTSLTALTISAGCPNESFDCLKHLITLRRLSVQDCQHLVSLPPLPALVDLHELTLSNCPAVERFALPSTLRRVLLESCGRIQELSDVAGADLLEELRIISCQEFRKLGPLGGCVRLEVLKVIYCGKVEYPTWNGLHLLKELNVGNRIILSEVPALPYRSLTMLSLSGMTGFTTLPDLSGMQSLRIFKLCKCPDFNRLPLLNLPSLQKFMMIAAKLQIIPVLDGLPALRELHLFCRSLVTLPPLTGLTALRVLGLQGCMNLESLPPLRGMTSLQRLNVKDCSQLKELPLEGLSPDIEVEEDV